MLEETRARFHGIALRISFIGIAVIPRLAARHGYFSRDLISSLEAQRREINKRAPVSERVGNYIVAVCDNILYDVRDYFRPSDVAFSCLYQHTAKAEQ